MNSPHRPTILLVDDDPGVLTSLQLLFEDDYNTVCVTSGADAITQVSSRNDISAIVLDMKMVPMDGLATAAEIDKLGREIPVIFHTGYPGEYLEEDIEIAHPPFDFILKGQSVSRLIRSVRNAVKQARLKEEAQSRAISESGAYGMIGRSAAMRAVFETIRRVIAAQVKVVILGESGTGKELVARAIHAHSRQNGGKLGIFNCNHKSADLVESELFGHTRGAFTGAVVDMIGVVESCSGGTLFLDEIGDLDLTTQAKLLRVLESGEYQRVGDPTVRHSEFRLICATHRKLEELVAQGKFREDLYYRLREVVIHLPALRQRREDIPMLAGVFLDRFTIEQDLPPKSFHPEAIDLLVRYDWPGNVRQLLGIVRTLSVFSESNVILRADVARELGNSSEDKFDSDDGLQAKVDAYRRALIIEALARSGGNISQAAMLLKIDRSNLRKYVTENDIPLQ
jgi:DNA-binding NtrC family response regulator